MIPKFDTKQYICDKFLDLVEKQPFSEIKVRQLVDYAGIGRSTFYMHFDSIYDVVQYIEDKFIEGFMNDNTAISIHIGEDLTVARQQILYIRANRRAFLLLSGPNGDIYFNIKITAILRKLTYAVLNKQNLKINPLKSDFLSEHFAYATLAMVKWVAEHPDIDIDTVMEITVPTLEDISRHLINASP